MVFKFPLNQRHASYDLYNVSMIVILFDSTHTHIIINKQIVCKNLSSNVKVHLAISVVNEHIANIYTIGLDLSGEKKG